MKYATQPTAPEWFKEDDSKIYESATAGTSPFNEWYEFDNRDDALDLISKVFSSQSFVDAFFWLNGELYATDDIDEKSMVEAGSEEDFKLIEGATIADLGEVVDKESRF